MNSLLEVNNIYLDLEVKNKKELFHLIAGWAFKNGYITNEKSVVKSYLKREKEGDTGLEVGFAIPHAKCPEIKKATIFYLTLKNDIKWKGLDGQLINKVIALLIPDQADNLHLNLLSKIATQLMDDQFKEELNKCSTAAEILTVFKL